MCISFPHRHAGNSVQPGTNNRSKSDIGYLFGTENPLAYYNRCRDHLFGLSDCLYRGLAEAVGITVLMSAAGTRVATNGIIAGENRTDDDDDYNDSGDDPPCH